MHSKQNLQLLIQLDTSLIEIEREEREITSANEKAREWVSEGVGEKEKVR